MDKWKHPEERVPELWVPPPPQKKKKKKKKKRKEKEKQNKNKNQFSKGSISKPTTSIVKQVKKKPRQSSFHAKYFETKTIYLSCCCAQLCHFPGKSDRTFRRFSIDIGSVNFRVVHLHVDSVHSLRSVASAVTIVKFESLNHL